MSESSMTALVEALPATLSVGGTSIPNGVRITWSERADRLSFHAEMVEPEDPSVSLNDAGAISIDVLSGERNLQIRLQLFSEIDSAKTRWYATGRGISFELTKLRVGRWGALVAGVTPATIKVDWSQYMDEDEEREAKLYPNGYDIYKMRGAMGKDWGSNISQELAAQRQLQAINTSQPDDEDEEIACF